MAAPTPAGPQLLTSTRALDKKIDTTLLALQRSAGFHASDQYVDTATEIRARVIRDRGEAINVRNEALANLEPLSDEVQGTSAEERAIHEAYWQTLEHIKDTLDTQFEHLRNNRSSPQRKHAS